MLTAPEGQGDEGPVRAASPPRRRARCLDARGGRHLAVPVAAVARRARHRLHGHRDGRPRRSRSRRRRRAPRRGGVGARETSSPPSSCAPVEAIRRARESSARPFLISESADSPTAGSTGDSPAMVRELLRHGAGLRAFVTLVDAAAVQEARAAGVGRRRSPSPSGRRSTAAYHEPVELSGTVAATGGGSYRLTGPVFTGMEVSMGAWALIECDGLAVLVTERARLHVRPGRLRACRPRSRERRRDRRPVGQPLPRRLGDARRRRRPPRPSRREHAAPRPAAVRPGDAASLPRRPVTGS